MLLEILTIISIVSISVKCNAQDHEHKHAVSTQSYHRDDVPLSYKYRSVHIYTTPHPEQRQYHQQEKPIYHKIQYAPLKQKISHSDVNFNHITSDQHDGLTQIPITKPGLYVTERNVIKHNLEPREETEYMDVHDQRYNSFVPGHNIEVLQSNHAYAPSDLYRPFHNDFQNQKVITPKFAIYQKPEKQFYPSTDDFEKPAQKTLSEGHNILYTLQKSSPNINYDANKDEKPLQALYPRIPRLHLNIARVYGVAHLTQQAPVNNLQAHKNRASIKHPAYTQAFFLPLRPPAQKNTILYPVQDTHKNYPEYTRIS